jgi:type III restriction enzyme
VLRSARRERRAADRSGEPPPVLIVVCPNTIVSKLVFDWLAGRESEFPDGTSHLVSGNLPLLSNVEDDGIWTNRQRTILIDSEQLESGEPLGADFRKAAAREQCRLPGALLGPRIRAGCTVLAGRRREEA